MKNKYLKTNNGSVTTILILLGLLVVIFIGVFFFRSTQQDKEVEIDIEKKSTEESKSEEEFNKKMISIIDEFIGLPYVADPLNEEFLYTEEGFNSTTLVLSVIAKAHNKDNPEEIIKKINYYPPEVVKYENRNHFSSYRNKVSSYFNDITSNIGKDYTKTKEVTLNKKKSDGKRIIDIDWERKIELKYIPIENITSIIDDIPPIVGVMFVQDKDEEIGLDVRGEGIIIENKEFVYASSKEKKVIKIDFLEYIENTNFDGVAFYEFINI